MTEVRLLSDDEVSMTRLTRKRATKPTADAALAPSTDSTAALPAPAKTRRTRVTKVQAAFDVTSAPLAPPMTAEAPAVKPTRRRAAAPILAVPEPDHAPGAVTAADPPIVKKVTRVAIRRQAADTASDAPPTASATAAAAATVAPAHTRSAAPRHRSASNGAAAETSTPNQGTAPAQAAEAPAPAPMATLLGGRTRRGTKHIAAADPKATEPAPLPVRQELPPAAAPEPPVADTIRQVTAEPAVAQTSPIPTGEGSRTAATPPVSAADAGATGFRPLPGSVGKQFTPRPPHQRLQQNQKQAPQFTPRPPQQTPQSQQPQNQGTDFAGAQGLDPRGRRRRRRRSRGPLPLAGNGNGASYSATNGNSPQAGVSASPPAYEERQQPVEFIPQQRMPVFEVHGILDFVPNGEAFLREEDLRTRGDDPLIGVRDIRRFDLRNGDIVQLEARPGRGRGPVTVERVLTINDVPFDQIHARKHFEDLTPIYPDRMITLETGAQPLTTRLIDMIAPVGFGQRALIVSPPKAGKTTVLKHIGHGVVTNYPEASLILCLVGERPEEVTDLRVSLPQAIMFASSFDEEVERHGHLAEMAMERARRLAEMGKDVIVLLDSITRLARAYNLGGGSGGRTLSGGMDASALTTARRIFGAARAIEQGGSLTIIGTCLVDTGSRLDDVVYEEFKGTGNMELHLDRGLAERRIFPAIDITKSSTRKEELLLDPLTLKWVVLLRRRLAGAQMVAATEQFIDRLGRSPSNQVFLELLSRAQS
jgi:transcription termination factor Rho